MGKCVVRLCALALIAGALWAQRGVELGAQLYRTNCAVCHGPNGDTVAGVDLWSGKFRRVSSDGELIGIMRNGIPETAMPPANLTESQAGQILAYLHFEADQAARIAALPGDPAKGRALFDGKGGCLVCHRVGAQGSRVGPDLTDIGSQRRTPEELQRAILEPGAEILPQNRFVHVVMHDGAKVSGRLLNHDAFTVQLIDMKEQLRSFQKAKLREFSVEKTSPMPSYQGKLSSEEIADLVVYLVSLKGVTP